MYYLSGRTSWEKCHSIQPAPGGLRQHHPRDESDNMHQISCVASICPVSEPPRPLTAFLNERIDYNVNFAAEFSRNKLASLMYRRTICADWWPVWFMIDRSDAPAIAALVACPARRL